MRCCFRSASVRPCKFLVCLPWFLQTICWVSRSTTAQYSVANAQWRMRFRALFSVEEKLAVDGFLEVGSRHGAESSLHHIYKVWMDPRKDGVKRLAGSCAAGLGERWRGLGNSGGVASEQVRRIDWRSFILTIYAKLFWETHAVQATAIAPAQQKAGRGLEATRRVLLEAIMPRSSRRKRKWGR